MDIYYLFFLNQQLPTHLVILLQVHDDQKRVVTPQQARELGSNGIVVGRPITLAEDPVSAYQMIRQAFMEGEN